MKKALLIPIICTVIILFLFMLKKDLINSILTFLFFIFILPLYIKRCPKKHSKLYVTIIVGGIIIAFLINIAASFFMKSFEAAISQNYEESSFYSSIGYTLLLITSLIALYVFYNLAEIKISDFFSK